MPHLAFFPMRCLLLSAIYCYDVMCIGDWWISPLELGFVMKCTTRRRQVLRKLSAVVGFFLNFSRALCADNIYIALYKFRAAVLVKSTHTACEHISLSGALLPLCHHWSWVLLLKAHSRGNVNNASVREDMVARVRGGS